MENINWNEFKKVEIRTGTIITVEDFTEAKNQAYRLTIDLGENIGIKKTSAQITALYSKKDLIKKQVIVVVNLPLKQIGPHTSDCLITGFYCNKDTVVLAVPDKKISNGLLLA